jgi:hypothetical protein
MTWDALERNPMADIITPSIKSFAFGTKSVGLHLRG